MTRSIAILLEDMAESASQLEKYTTDMTFENFSNDRLVQDAVMRRIEILGRCVPEVSSELLIYSGEHLIHDLGHLIPSKPSPTKVRQHPSLLSVCR